MNTDLKKKKEKENLCKPLLHNVLLGRARYCWKSCQETEAAILPDLETRSWWKSSHFQSLHM